MGGHDGQHRSTAAVPPPLKSSTVYSTLEDPFNTERRSPPWETQGIDFLSTRVPSNLLGVTHGNLKVGILKRGPSKLIVLTLTTSFGGAGHHIYKLLRNPPLATSPLWKAARVFGRGFFLPPLVSRGDRPTTASSKYTPSTFHNWLAYPRCST